MPLLRSTCLLVVLLAFCAGCPQPAQNVEDTPSPGARADETQQDIVPGGAPTGPESGLSTPNGSGAPPDAGNSSTDTSDELFSRFPIEPKAPQRQCRREITLRSGEVICFEDLLPLLVAELPDNDRDGIPNSNDPDIDGDGVPNGFDVDVDGDGIPNSIDDDIDDDGVPNDIDVDMDGDFLRNRWDFDIDGDLLYNPLDLDADGDGLTKLDPIEPLESCGPVEQFNDPDTCPDPDDPEENDPNAPAENTETPENDRGGEGEAGANLSDEALDALIDQLTPDEIAELLNELGLDEEEQGDPNDVGLALQRIFASQTEVPEEPTAAEENAFDEMLRELVGEDGLVEEIEVADPSQTRAAVFDDVRQIIEQNIEDHPPTAPNDARPGLDPEALAELDDQRTVIQRLASAPNVSVDDAIDVTNRFNAARRTLSTPLLQLADVTEAVSIAADPDRLVDAGRQAVALTDEAVDAGLPAEQVAPAVAPAARTAVTSQETLEAVWKIVVDNVSAFRDEDGLVPFSLVSATRTVERIAALANDPSLERVNASFANVLQAADSRNQTDPLAIIAELEANPNEDLSDGISREEAERGAAAL